MRSRSQKDQVDSCETTESQNCRFISSRWARKKLITHLIPTATTGLPTFSLRATRFARSYCGQCALPVTKPPPCIKTTTGKGPAAVARAPADGTETLRVRHSVSLNSYSGRGRACCSSRCSRSQLPGSATGRGLRGREVLVGVCILSGGRRYLCTRRRRRTLAWWPRWDPPASRRARLSRTGLLASRTGCRDIARRPGGVRAGRLGCCRGRRVGG